MAVRVGDRDEGKLQVIECSKNLVKYTYDRVHSKTLPKADRWLASKSIWDAVSNAHAHILIANGIRVESQSDAEERLLHEKLAIGNLDTLISWIDILNMKKIISDDQASYWTGLATKTQNICKAWLKSNKQQYKQYMGN